MKPTPSGWPRIASSIFYDDAARAIDWLCSAFGFELRLKVEGEAGRIEYSELTYGEGMVSIASVNAQPSGDWRDLCVSPRSLKGANTQVLCLYVDDVDTHCAHALAAGAELVRPLETKDYGAEYWTDRSYGVRDLEGHSWWFMQRMGQQS
jgi:uncharacterized glyoxalase superfamily protein PhnB